MKNNIYIFHYNICLKGREKRYKFFILISFIIITLIIFIKNNKIKGIIIKKKLQLKIKNRLIKFQKNHPLILKEKHDLLTYISNITGRKISRVKSIFLNYTEKFGNQLILLNKVIFFCEILRCKKIILNKNIYWFLKRKIIDREYNMIIEIDKESNYRNKDIIIDNTRNFFWYFNIFEPEYRPNLIQKELINNLPKIKVNPNALYVYIRSGDIFINFYRDYIQPPLCFYRLLLSYFKFNQIYLIAENENNPVISQLLIQFPNIIFQKNSIKLDISYLINAYNIVGAYSTFLNYIIKYNDNLKSFWYFDFKFNNFYYYIFFSFILYHHVNQYKMYESNYYKVMQKCSTIKCKKDIMINYTCSNKIFLIK